MPHETNWEASFDAEPVCQKGPTPAAVRGIGCVAQYDTRHPIQATLVLALAEWAFLVLVGRVASRHEVLGITGAGAALLAVIAASIAGPYAGVAVAAAGGLAFFVYLSH
jgi:hypothetical protein